MGFVFSCKRTGSKWLQCHGIFINILISEAKDSHTFYLLPFHTPLFLQVAHGETHGSVFPIFSSPDLNF